MNKDHRKRLQEIKSFPSLVKYLKDELGWPVESNNFEDLTFDYTPEELGIDSKNAAKIDYIKRLRPMVPNQPWGIFFVSFEPKQLPVVALRRILNQLVVKKRVSVDREGWKIDDLLFISAYGEGDHRQISVANFSNEEQIRLPTLKVLGWNNLDTNLYLDYIADTLHQYLSWPDDDGDDVELWRESWRRAFTIEHREQITTSSALALRLAELARAIRDRLSSAIAIETQSGPLRMMKKAFQSTLIHDLTDDDFADMYAQTIAYGLLSARITQKSEGNDDLSPSIPVTNPFLKELLETFLNTGQNGRSIGGITLDFDELGVNEVVQVLNNSNMEAVVRDFGDRNPQEDPVIHFYELFLKEYDANKRMERGVFYTPRPVVSYIVRSIDELLRAEFGLEDGLADTATWGEMANRHRDLKIPKNTSGDQSFVQILDPATGTGTFLVEVIDMIHKTMIAKWIAQGHGDEKIAVLWNEYVPKQLLPRLHAYELLMAPYAIAHLKVGLKLHETGYRFRSDERARIYLTNALEPVQDFSGTFEFAIPALAHEARAVNEIKGTQRFTVVIGNPPYSKSMSKHPYSMSLVDDFKRGLNEKKSDLTREEWKFLRFGYYNIESASVGIVGYVINNAFLSAPTLRGIRHFLLTNTSHFMTLDLHGDSRKGEISPDGSPDKNVFDIQQGVCVMLGVRSPRTEYPIVARKADLFGTQQHKYEELAVSSAGSTAFREMSPRPPMFLFRDSERSKVSPYELWPSVTDLFINRNTGIQTKNDNLFVDTSKDVLCLRMSDVLANISKEQASISKKYALKDSAGWQVSKLNNIEFDKDSAREFLYKPFDHRFIYYNTAALGRARHSTMQHMMKPNLALVVTRQVTRLPFCHAFVSRWPIEEKTGSHDRTTQLLPLYLYPQAGGLEFSRSENQNDYRESALSPSLISKLDDVLGSSVDNGCPAHNQDLLDPERVFQYTYSILNSPSYREQFGSDLMQDFPRVPLTGNADLYRSLANLGGELVALHLMESPKLRNFITSYIGSKRAHVERVSWSNDTVWIDTAATKKGHLATPGTIGFRGVPEAVWNFRIGGYQVCEKWLKDRKGCSLSDSDIAHYQKIVVALNETIRIMGEIDESIERHGGWPDAFETS